MTGWVPPVASRAVAVLAAPVLLRQGKRIRRDIPVLPEASGPRHGVEGPAAKTPAAEEPAAKEPAAKMPAAKMPAAEEPAAEEPAGEGSAAGAPGEPLRLLVFGESTAAGVGAATQADGLGRVLAAGLAARADREVSWTVVGRNGTTAAAARRRLVPELDGSDFDAVLVCLGVNDMLRLRSRRTWRRDLAGVLADLSGHLRPGGRIVVAGLPDLGRFPSLPQPLRAVLALHARSLDGGSAQVAARTPDAVHAAAPPIEGDDFFATDGFHPSGPGYGRWARALAAGWPDLRTR